MPLKNLYTEKSFKEYQWEQRATLFGNRRYIFHIFIWILSAVMFYVVNPENAEISKIYPNPSLHIEKFALAIRIISTIVGLIISAFFIYTFLLLIIPFSKYKAQNRFIVLSIILQIFLFFIIMAVTIVLNHRMSFFNFGLIIQSWISIIYIQFNFLALYFFLDIFDKQNAIKKYSNLLEQRLIAESKFLSSQINPHFLFNTINNIYSLSMKDKGRTIIGIEKLESLIEYIHYKSQKEFITLDDEIKFLNSYIDLELLRYQNTSLDVQFDVNGQTDEIVIAPLILITFIENAFKHGIKNNKKNPFIHISLEVTEDKKIHFEIINPINEQQQHSLDKNIGGIGMINTMRRLELIYPSLHKIKTTNKNNIFSVELSIHTDD